MVEFTIMEKEKTKSLSNKGGQKDEVMMEEDVQFTIICIIQNFFEQEPNEDLFKYFEDINKLIAETDELVEKEVKNSSDRVKLANAINEVKIDDYWDGGEVEESKVKSEKKHDINSLNYSQFISDENIRDRVQNLRDKLILNELEDRHSSAFDKVLALFQIHIDDQMEELKRDKEEILYFSDFKSDDDPEIQKVTDKLIKEHTEKIREKLTKEVTNCPQIFVEYACELFSDYAIIRFTHKKQADEEDEEHKLISENIDDIQCEWETTVDNILSSIYGEKLKFWDQDVVGDKPENIDRVLKEFILSQRINSKRELKELQRCYKNLVAWMVKAMPWKNTTIEEYLKEFENFKDSIKIYSRQAEFEDNDMKFYKTRHELHSYCFKFIIIHFSMFLTKNVNQNSQFSCQFYNASYAQFLRNLIRSYYPKVEALKIVRSIEASIGNFNAKSLNIELQNPVNSPCNAVYKVEDFTSRLDFIKFANQISDHEDEFEEYLEGTTIVDKYGEVDEAKIEEIKKENYKLKSRYLISCMKMFSDYKESEYLKAHFDLLSKECSSSKHIMISISGMRSGGGKLTAQWEKYLEDNKSLTLYAFRWKSKGMLPSAKSMIPSLSNILDLANLLNKVYLAYRVIKIPIDYREKFINNWEMAKVYGKILAHALLIQFPFINQPVSLIGFMLGAQVLFSCLEELHHK